MSLLVVAEIRNQAVGETAERRRASQGEASPVPSPLPIPLPYPDHTFFSLEAVTAFQLALPSVLASLHLFS